MGMASTVRLSISMLRGVVGAELFATIFADENNGEGGGRGCQSGDEGRWLQRWTAWSGVGEVPVSGTSAMGNEVAVGGFGGVIAEDPELGSQVRGRWRPCSEDE